MIHNGIEYGMMSAIGEGFALLDASPYADSFDFAAHFTALESGQRRTFVAYGLAERAFIR